MLSIRTQDRTGLFVYHGIFISPKWRKVDTGKPVANTEYLLRDRKTNDILGEYATKERAFGVLDEIQGAICDNEYMEYTYLDKLTGYSPFRTIYKMPKN